MPNGVVLGIATAVSWGTSDFIARFAIKSTGSVRALFGVQCWGAVFLTILLAQKSPLRIAGKRAGAQLYSMAFFDTAAFALSNLGMRIEQVAIVSLLGSLYGAVTVALAAIFLRERIAPLQWSGIAAIFLGIVLMNS